MYINAPWAKSNEELIGNIYKPVTHHLTDVGACALCYLNSNPNRLRREAALTKLKPILHTQLCAFLSALHDLGKISVVFQSQRRDLWPSSILGPWPEKTHKRYGHWEATALLLNSKEVKAAMAPLFGPAGLPPLLISAVAGHHGKAPLGEHANAREWQAAHDPEIGPACVKLAAEVVTALVALFPDLYNLPRLPRRQLVNFSFALNGLITLADWVGSDAEHFAYVDPATPIETYWPLALAAADRALSDKGLVPARSRIASLAELSGHARAARPTQAMVVDLEVPPEPQLVIIEDGTGSGKTEAALLLATRMMAAGLGEGVFVALPTMATANAMHGRLDRAMSGLFDGPASLVLAHGKSALANALGRLSSTQSDEPNSVAAHFNAWIGDSRKKAFFADVGAGTIDQTFLSILPKKHLTMRQYALAGRILIVDEAHACDAYMGEELKRLLEMQARLGGSAIVLSATLNRAVRDSLVKAFSEGRDLCTGLGEEADIAPYPLVTRWCASTGLEQHSVETPPELARSISIQPLPSREAGLARALEAARQGAAVIMICNTVDAATESYDALIAAGHDPARCHLAHARFVVEDRLEIEARIQALFRRESTAEMRAGHILVGTQVLEQSLDLDADVMLSDLAPIDLIIQRAGRLWRHQRDGRPVGEPVLYLLTAPPCDAVSANWLDETLGSAVHVYKLPGVMWRTSRLLIDKRRLDTPQDLRHLIEAAYATDESGLPEALQAGHRDTLGRIYGEKTIGANTVINPQNGYSALINPSNDEEIGTRLGERQVTLRLARHSDGALVPLVRRAGADDRLNWPLSEISVRANWLARHAGSPAPEPADQALVEKTRLGWPEWERAIPLYAVADDGTIMTASPSGLMYDAKRGLRHVATMM